MDPKSNTQSCSLYSQSSDLKEFRRQSDGEPVPGACHSHSALASRHGGGAAAQSGRDTVVPRTQPTVATKGPASTTTGERKGKSRGAGKGKTLPRRPKNARLGKISPPNNGGDRKLSATLLLVRFPRPPLQAGVCLTYSPDGQGQMNAVRLTLGGGDVCTSGLWPWKIAWDSEKWGTRKRIQGQGWPSATTRTKFALAGAAIRQPCRDTCPP